jgi:hypothetical protein
MSSHGHRSAGSAQHHTGHQPDGGDRDDPSHQASLCAFAVAGLAFVDGLNHAPFDALTTRELASPVYDDTFRDHGPLGVVRIRGPPLGS